MGFDRGLAGLLREIARVDGIEWLRFLYAFPTTITDPLLEVMAEEEKICSYIDMPLQHASDRVLRAMKRPGTRSGYRKLIDSIRKSVPDVAIRSSFIVGFPGETREDFQVLREFCRDKEFDHLGVFLYSDEEGTEAFGRDGGVSSPEKERRRDELQGQQVDISLRRNRLQIGNRRRVLVEGPSTESDLLLQGRTEGQAPEIDSAVLINDGLAEPGTFVTVEITEAHPFDLVGRIVDGGSAGPFRPEAKASSSCA